MNRKWKKISAVFFLVIFMISCIKPHDIYASTPVSLALKLTDSSMRKGDTMHVSVAIQNYDESYTENVITTIIIEVSVDTEAISVNKSSIAANFDEGSGMGFLAAQMKDESNVELQYLNVSDPLKKGTTDLYGFDITALKDIDNLLNSIQITYAVMQDGTKAVSEKLTVVPFAMINGKVLEQESIEEKYTSEYGTMALHTSSGGADSQSSSSPGNSQTGSFTAEDGSEGEDSTTGASPESSIAGGGSTSDNSTVDSEGSETKKDSSGNSQGEEETDSKMQSGKTEHQGAEKEAADAETTGKGWSKTAVILVIVFIAAAVLAGILIYRKKNKNISQNNHNYRV